MKNLVNVFRRAALLKIAVLVTLFAVFSCSDEGNKTPEVKYLKLEPTKVSLICGHTYNLNLTVVPKSISPSELRWDSSNSEVAEIVNGKTILTYSEGETVISVSDSGDKKAECKVYVTKKEVLAESVRLKKREIEITTGQTYLLETTIFPENTTDCELVWESLNEEIVTVDEKGKVSAVSDGKATVRVSSKKSPSAFDTCIITVTE